ncbi:MAG TPA: acyl-CoA dehydrogenase, partial [Dehalococcoidia bacterium]|nr:acyl-CoA dehydrogenase [Dehalococcoidia bacterium]
MDFHLTEAEQMLQATAREFAKNEIEPVADAVDKAEVFAMDNFKKLAEVGFTGLAIPAEYGGSGGDIMSLCIVMEELARACASTCDIVDAHLSLCARPIYLYGNEEQRKKYLPPLCSGEKVGAFAITEAEAGSDIANIKMTATRDGDDYILNGSKLFITNATVCDTVVVFASVPELAPRGMTAFIVEADMPGFNRGPQYEKLGMKGAGNAELIFDNVRVPSANRLGDEGKGMRICLGTLDEGRIGIACQAVGIAQAVLDRCIEYAKERKQFGKPIGENQAIQWMLVEMACRIESARLLTYKAAKIMDEGGNPVKAASMAKLVASEAAMDIATKGIQIFGGYGYMMDSPMQRYFR